MGRSTIIMEEFLRLDATPPRKSPPPADAVDLIWDVDSSTVLVELPDGSRVTFAGGVTQSAADARYLRLADVSENTKVTPGTVPQSDGNGQIAVASVFVPDNADPETSDGSYLSARALSLFTGLNGSLVLDANGANITGNITITPPESGGTMAVTQNTSGVPDMFIPPTSDPHVAGAVWNNSGTLAISAG